MKKHSARVAPLSACNSPVLTLTKVEGNAWGGGAGLCPSGAAVSWRQATGLPGLGAPFPGSAPAVQRLWGWHLAAPGLPGAVAAGSSGLPRVPQPPHAQAPSCADPAHLVAAAAVVSATS